MMDAWPAGYGWPAGYDGWMATIHVGWMDGEFLPDGFGRAADRWPLPSGLPLERSAKCHLRVLVFS